MKKYLFDRDSNVSLVTMRSDNIQNLLYGRVSFYDAKVWATRGELEQIFGDPTIRKDYGDADCHFEWVLDALFQNDKRIVTVYDFNYFDDNDVRAIPPVDKHIEWHIGGWGESETWKTKVVIEKRLREMRSGLIHELKYVSALEGKGERLYTPCPFREKTPKGDLRYVCENWCYDCPHFVFGNGEGRVVICKHENQNDMNLDLIGFLESKEFRSDKKIGHLIQLNGRYLTAKEVRMVVRAAVKAGYKDLYSVPDEFAENVLKNK